MTDPPRHRETYRVRSYETDPLNRVTVRNLLLLLQEAATGHAAALDISVQSLISNGLAWVLTQLRLDMDRWPHGGDSVIVETWPRAANRVIIDRRFLVMDDAGNELGRATTLWVVMDLERRRPVRLPEFIRASIEPLLTGDRPEPTDPIPEVTSAELERHFEVRYSDLDMVHHVNNAASVQWAVETTPDELRQTRLPFEVEVRFLAECRYGDSARSISQQADSSDSFIHSLYRRSDDAEILRARSSWKAEADGS
jgi:acyl-ACP thioesterase